MPINSCGHAQGNLAVNSEQRKWSKMHHQRRVNDSVHWYMGQLSSRVVATSGRPEDRYHLGKLILLSLKDTPEFVLQIDGGTNEQETSLSVFSRTVKCATAMKNMGLGCGDVIVLMGKNHLDLAIPYYAALYMGVAVAAVDRTLTVKELKETFGLNKPKLIFCQSEKAPDIQLALNQLEMSAEIVTFDRGDYLCEFSKFLETYADDIPVEEYRPADFDPEETIAMLISTSGTTGVPKAAMATHKNFAITHPYVWSRFSQFPTPVSLALIAAPLQWLTAILHFTLSALLRYTRLQSSLPFTAEHARFLINKYKPTYTVLSPTLMTTLIKPGDGDECDFSCFEHIYLGGSAVAQDLIVEVQKVATNAEVFNVFGMTELTSLGFHTEDPAPGSCGKPLGCFQYRIMDLQSEQDITEPKVPGELWVKGPGVFKGYYNNPEATEDSFAEDGWLKTGDMFYRDEQWNYFFVERIKLLLKYMSHHISPVELENVIRQHPGVLDVAVAGLEDRECGELPVAVVVRRPGCMVTADDIKELVRESLTESKQLRGGVIFLKELPMTASTKIHRRRLKEIIYSMDRK